MTILSKILNDGHSVPVLAFGTGTTHMYNRSDVTEPITLALSAGITHLDTAQHYQNEHLVGAALVSNSSNVPREKLFITTKVYELKDEDGHRTIRETLQASLRKLCVDAVDLFLIHTPATFSEKGKLEDAWRQMEAVKEEGLAKSIGVSNFSAEDLERVLKVAKIVPAVNQIEYHPYLYTASRPVFDLARKHGVLIACYGSMSPISREADGPLTPILEQIRQRLEQDKATTDDKSNNQNGTSVKVSAGQVLLKWLWQCGLVAVTTSSKAERIKEYVDAASLPDLTAEEIQAINDAGAKHHYRHFWTDKQ